LTDVQAKASRPLRQPRQDEVRRGGPAVKEPHAYIQFLHLSPTTGAVPL